MNLIGYSDSEDSDNDAPQAPVPAAKPALKVAPKPSFYKVVDRSNPGKIKLQLPTPTQPRPEADDIDADGPPAKKARTGGGAFGGFNSMLPAPKKPNLKDVSAVPMTSARGSRGAGKSLGVGVNLRTGAEPAFKREPEAEEYDENGDPIKQTEQIKQGKGKGLKKDDFRAMFNLPPTKTQTPVDAKPAASPPVTTPAVPGAKPKAKPIFLPLSVTRGKKKPTPRPAVAIFQSTNTASAPPAKAGDAEAKPAAKPKVSLFSVAQEEDLLPTQRVSDHEYKPLLYGADDGDEDAKVPDEAFNEQNAYHTNAQSLPAAASTTRPQNLTNIASDLNLTEAERRQLFGRKGHGPDVSEAKIIEFNTDSEYAYNEKIRQQGETVQHNALKSISGTGKNSLRSLINVAATQKDALEEHFAAGRRNKREAGSKYGW